MTSGKATDMAEAGKKLQGKTLEELMQEYGMSFPASVNDPIELGQMNVAAPYAQAMQLNQWPSGAITEWSVV